MWLEWLRNRNLNLLSFKLSSDSHLWLMVTTALPSDVPESPSMPLSLRSTFPAPLTSAPVLWNPVRLHGGETEA